MKPGLRDLEHNGLVRRGLRNQASIYIQIKQGFVNKVYDVYSCVDDGMEPCDDEMLMVIV